MKTLILLLTVSSLPVTARAQTPPPTVASEMGGQFTVAEREVLGLADALPEARYGFAPTTGEFKGVRTFAQQLKHIAAVNYEYCSVIRQEKSPVDINGEAGPDSIRTKADILTFVRESFAYCQGALRTIDEKNALQPMPGPFGGSTTRLAVATNAAAHPYDHYGQLVVYLRMNGLVPPASRPR